MFMPWGFGLVLLWQNFRRPLRVAGMCLAITLFIEVSQLFINRSVDVDDLILNFIGGVSEALLWYVLRRIKKSRSAN